MKKQLLVLICLAAGMLTSCVEDDYVDQSDVDQGNIQAYIAEKGLDLEYDAISGIHYKIYAEGNKEKRPSVDSSLITVDYEGRLLNDTIFVKGDSVEMNMEDQPIGFQLGVSYIGEGGDILMIVPSQLAYGSASFITDTPYSATIPSNSILVYRVKLLKVAANQP